MQKGVKAIIFDIGGVLAISKVPSILIGKGKERHLGIHEYVAKKLKISVDQWFDSIDAVYSFSFEGKISYNKTLNIISKHTKTPKEKLRKILIKAYRKNFKQNKKLHRIAKKLKKRGYQIAILSDQWHPSKEAVVKKRYYQKFNPIIISCDVGTRKPNPKIYKLTLKKLKIPANQTLFIDNQVWNIKPAKKLGMKTILFKNNKQLISDLRKFGVNV